MKQKRRGALAIRFVAAMALLMIMVTCPPADCKEEFGYWVTYAQGIKITCTSTVFGVAAHTLNDRPDASVVKKGEGETIYYGFKTHDIRCPFGKHKMRVEFTTGEPREKGMCGGAPGSNVNIWIDSQLVMRQLFNNDCYESLASASFEQKEDGLFAFRICGHKGMPGYPIVNDCFMFPEDVFWSLSKPLPASPISKFKEEKSPHAEKRD